MSALSNLSVGGGAAVGDGNQLQLGVVPVLSALVASGAAEVRHAATLHLATLSHSTRMRDAIAAERTAPLGSLYKLEDSCAKPPPAEPAGAGVTDPAEGCTSPYHRRLRDEALVYARWSLRTSHGRNYKPAFEKNAFLARQARARGMRGPLSPAFSEPSQHTFGK